MSAATQPRYRAATAARIQPIVWWAVLGAGFVLLQIYVYGAWMLSPDFRPTDPGPDPIPAYSRNAMRIFEIISVTVGLVVLVWFVRGIRRQGHIDAVRLMMVGWLSAYWLDPWLSFMRPMFTYNAYLTNRGCWCEFIPGWQSVNGARIAEPLLVDPPNYFYNFTATAMAGVWAMNKASARWPGLGALGLSLAALPAIWLAMGVLDVAATRLLHFDAWPLSTQSLSFWGGRFYQFPAYEFLIFPADFIACAYLLYRRDAAGHTRLERGLERVSPRWQTTARVLAFCAFCNLLNLAYTSTMAVISLGADPWPADMPSWLANEQCGVGTPTPCPVQ